MAPSYSSNGGYGYSSSSYTSFQPKHRRSESTSVLDDIRAFLAHSSRSAWRFWRERGRFMAWAAIVNAGRRLRLNLSYNRLFSFPHLLVAAWIVVLLWGERWVFHSAVEECAWEKWEKWVRPNITYFCAPLVTMWRWEANSCGDKTNSPPAHNLTTSFWWPIPSSSTRIRTPADRGR